MGVTVLEPGAVWNTYPPIRTRAAWKFTCISAWPETRVFHLQGEPLETRHVVVANEQAVISSWSIQWRLY